MSHLLLKDSIDVSKLIKYVQKWGGGNDGRFIADLNAFHTVYVPAGRIIPSATFGAIADLKLGPDELCPLFACAIVKAQATCPKDKVCSRVCRFITASDIVSCQSTRKATRIHTCVRAYVHAYVRTCIHAYMQAYLTICICESKHTLHTEHTHIHIHTYWKKRLHTYMHTHAYMHTCIHAYMHTCIRTYMYTCIHAYTHECIYAHMHSITHTFIHTYTHTHVHTHAYMHMHIYIYTYIYIQTKAKMLEAETVLAKARELAQTSGVASTVATRLLGRADVMMARFVLGKPIDKEKCDSVQAMNGRGSIRKGWSVMKLGGMRWMGV